MGDFRLPIFDFRLGKGKGEVLGSWFPPRRVFDLVPGLWECEGAKVKKSHPPEAD